MATLIGWVVGMGVFIVWISLVGNPHVVETAIGLIMGVAAGYWAYRKLRRPRTNS